MDLGKICKTVSKDLSFVVIGNYNPCIMSQDWLFNKDLINDLQYKSLQEDKFIIHRDITQLAFDDFSLKVTPIRFEVSTSCESNFQNLFTILNGIFSSLKETPVSQIGLNYTKRIQFLKIGDWHSFGDFIAPKKYWNKTIANPGLMSMHIKEQPVDDSNGFRNLYLGISDAGNRVLKISVNNHYMFDEDAKADKLIEYLGIKSPSTVSDSESIIQEVIENVFAK